DVLGDCAHDSDVLNAMCCYLGFFFSSRRRHTSCLSDWSSDVCSSDLIVEELPPERAYRRVRALAVADVVRDQGELAPALHALLRSEERRVGKECRARLWLAASK